ncbi:ATPase [Candidatus Pacearchaeota archaeon CG10_big_fil_rev_8_21_14_0_10_34_76]|nr:MAG: ATPase [Candidatus Pacearchaeota archaeon CG10_big_fil_rev_8_21_14_0_10_34_76]
MSAKTEDNRPSSSEVKKAKEVVSNIRNEMSKSLIGQKEIVDGLIMALLCDGHVLIEGVPGIAKTLAVRSLAKISGASVERIQFTVDLLPTDIVGITAYTPGKGFRIEKGPVFTNFIIADEINRSPPKTQSALIEAMQEKQVTIGKKTFELTPPFFVMATQNPIEQSGVYPLPEAQIDRFLFKLIMEYPEREEEDKIMENNMTLMDFDSMNLRSVTTPHELIRLQKLTKKVYLAPKVKRYILDIIEKTRIKDFKYGELIEWGCSPRASISLYIAAKAHALMDGRNFAVPQDVRKVALPVLRHRMILSYKAAAEKISADTIIKHILDREVSA